MPRLGLTAAIAAALILPLVAVASSDRRFHEPRLAQPSGSAETVGANENRHPAGVDRNGTLSVQLEIGEGVWKPDPAMPSYQVLAFAEAGRPMTSPGPLIRVRVGTPVDVTIRNHFDKDITIRGLGGRAAAPAPVLVHARDMAVARFTADTAGTFYYWGTLGQALADRTGIDSQLTGALIVDPPGGTVDDRVFVIGLHEDEPPAGLSAYVINGRSWPLTERLTYTVGERVRWRWINATGEQHPMHLHGHYFTVTSMGDNARDESRAPSRRALAVTQALPPAGTMALAWTPQRPGNWLFHCHILFHTIPDNRLPLPQWYDEYADLPHDQHMSGLVMGVEVTAAASAQPQTNIARPVRQLTLRVGERAGVQYDAPGLSVPGLGYALDNGPVTAPGPTLTLERGQPAAVTIVNEIKHATSIHWHGIELESYYDGVPHFSGDSHAITPPIPPGGRFVARFTPPRAGTFIYHTHFNDFVQLSTGLYGALIVLEPGRALDPGVDHVFVISRGGPDDEKSPVLLNGAVDGTPLTLRRGVAHRFRLIGITPVPAARVRLIARDSEQPVAWRAVAKDGADLPPALATSQSADLLIFPGETYDFEYVPDRPGELVLEATLDQKGGPRAAIRLVVGR